ncbi:MAG TPA: YceI family protein [Vicinamibacterales bacterium]|nr:YceI family protein [Vicinamibacterales bacterium]
MLPGARTVHVLAAGLCAGVVAIFASSAHAQQPNVDFSVSGTSTIRGWTCSAKGVIAVTPGTGGSPAVPGFANGVQSATVTVPVKAFACPNAEMLEHLMQAMKAEKFSEIVYRLERYEGTGPQFQATGTMTITGTSQPVSFPVVLKASGQSLQVEGTTRLDMTTYGIDPPVVMLGMLKVAPLIRIEFKGAIAP